MLCPDCGLEQLGGNKFCEDCGARLAPQPVTALAGLCPRCGAGPGEVEVDGLCSRCGHERVPSRRAHMEMVVSARLAGVSDRGKNHACNEDFLALESDRGGDLLVVCDGVSNSQNPDGASAAAARTVRDRCRIPLRACTSVTQEHLAEALRAAHTAVAALPWLRTLLADPPETTIVAALRQGGRILVGWLGDSRAYLAGPECLRPLTQDHSWINEVVSAGKMTEQEAVEAPQAHCITRSLGGPGSGAGDEPSLLTIDLVEPWQYLILCTDGLWNYVPTPEQFLDLVRRRPAGGALAQFLVDYALERGGRDNVTVAVLDLAQG